MHSIYKNKKVFITGHTGFKGSWLSAWLQSIGAEVAGYSLEAEKLSHFNLLNLKTKNYFSDINDEDKITKAIAEFKPDIVFHLAAQPLVRSSYENPVTTFDTNVIGSLKVYRAALKSNVPALVSITTDKVYENKESHHAYNEADQLGGHDPYSSSKACMEIMTESFKKSYLADGKMLLATARAGNVIGGGDWACDRLIPDLVRNASINLPTTVRNPESIRPWQHVLDPLNGYLLLGEKLLAGEKKFATSFNFGPDFSGNLTVRQMAELAKIEWDAVSIKTGKPDLQKHEAHLLKLDISKAKSLLEWQPTWNVSEAITNTLKWYKDYYMNSSINSLLNIKNFQAKNK